MRVVITGGCGFIGQLLARSVLRQGSLRTHVQGGGEAMAPVTEILLADAARPPRGLLFDDLDSASVVLGDLSDASFCRSLFEGTRGEPTSVFHLGAIMSGEGEADFDRCVAVNLSGTHHLLEAARRCASARPRFILAGAGATIGSGAPTDFVRADDTVSDATRATPHTTYGMAKACAELLLSDYSRKGFVDGRGCRLPTVIVRAGAPNAATTGCYSAVVREVLAGRDVCLPIGADVTHAVTSHRAAVGCLLGLHEVAAPSADAVLGFDRTVFVPSAAVTLTQLDDAVRRVVHPDSHGKLGGVSYDVDEELSATVGSFPAQIDCGRATALGLSADLELESIVREYAHDFPADIAPGVELRDRYY